MPLRNEDMTDRELLHNIRDVEDAQGVFSAEDLAYVLGYVEDGRGIPQKVTTRLAWMVRFEWIMRVLPEDPGTKGSFYAITEKGDALLHGKISKNTEQAINKASIGDQVLIMRTIARHAFDSDDSTATAVRREYLHHQAHRR